MLKKFEDKYGLSTTEIVTVFTVITTFYAVIYKVSFLYFLDLTWYIGLLSPQQIILSSIVYLALAFVAVILGVCESFLIKQIDYNQRSKWSLIVQVTTLVIYIGLIIGFKDQFLTYFLTNLVIAFMITEKLRVRKELQAQRNELHFNPNHYKRLRLIIIIFVTVSLIIILVVAPSLAGHTSAQKILNEREKISTEVTIKGDINKWYIIETTNDKALVIKENKRNEKEKFKIIELKEITELTNNLGRTEKQKP